MITGEPRDESKESLSDGLRGAGGVGETPPGGVLPESAGNAGDPQAATPAATPSQPARRRERSGTLEALLLVLIAFLLALTLKTYVAEAYEIKGKSMEPTFGNGQRVVVLKAFYELNRGDIVVFSLREDPGKDLIKRIVGLPGETVGVRGGRVYINGKRLEEREYDIVLGARGGYEGSREAEPIPKGSYYVLGDNRPDSHDSRVFHSIKADMIKGKVLVRWWPFREFRAF